MLFRSLLAAEGVEVRSVSLARPTLDDVFHHVVGGRLVDTTDPMEVAA